DASAHTWPTPSSVSPAVIGGVRRSSPASDSPPSPTAASARHAPASATSERVCARTARAMTTSGGTRSTRPRVGARGGGGRPGATAARHRTRRATEPGRGRPAQRTRARSPLAELVPACRARNVHRTSSVRRYELAGWPEVGLARRGRAGGCAAGRRVRGAAGAVERAPAAELVPVCRARSVHRTSSVRGYELVGWLPGVLARGGGGAGGVTSRGGASWRVAPGVALVGRAVVAERCVLPSSYRSAELVACTVRARHRGTSWWWVLGGGPTAGGGHV